MRWITSLVLLMAATSVFGAQRLLLRQDTQDVLRNKVNDNFSEVYAASNTAVRTSDSRGFTNSGSVRIAHLTLDGSIEMQGNSLSTVGRVGAGTGWFDFDAHAVSDSQSGALDGYDTQLWTGLNANYLQGRDLAWLTDLSNMSNAPAAWTSEVGLVHSAMTHASNTFVRIDGATMTRALTNADAIVIGSTNSDAGVRIDGVSIVSRDFGGNGINFEQAQFQLGTFGASLSLGTGGLAIDDSSLFTGLNAEFVGGVRTTGLVTKAGTSVVSGVIAMGEDASSAGASEPLRFDQYDSGSDERWTNFFRFYMGKPYIGTAYGDLGAEVLTAASAGQFALNGQSMTGRWYALGNTATNSGWVGGGQGNTAGGQWSAVAGGYYNFAHGQASAVAGGWNNAAYGLRSAIGGGNANVASGELSTVSGGYLNMTTGSYATIPGGRNNLAGYDSFAAGVGAKATHSNSFVWSSSDATFGSRTPRSFNVLAPELTVFRTYTFAIEKSAGSGFVAQFSDEGSQIWGPLTIEGYVTAAAGSAIDSRVSALEGAGHAVNGQNITGRWFAAGNTNSGVGAVVLGGVQNAAEGDYSFIGGGVRNRTAGNNSVVAGGYQNFAASSSVVAGGYENVASGVWATVAGGYQNVAAGSFSTVAGGRSNLARGAYSAVVGGYGNVAESNAVAAGSGALATNAGSLVWASPGGPTSTFGSLGDNTFNVRAAGGTYFLSTGFWIRSLSGVAVAGFTSTGITFSAAVDGAVAVRSGATTNTVLPSGFQFDHPTFGGVGYTLSFGRGLWRATNNAAGASTAVGPVWDGGNDGTGSGLDADLLDGQTASEFAPVSVYRPNVGGGAPGTKIVALATRTNASGAGIMSYDTGVSFASAALNIPQSAGVDYGFMFSPIAAAARWERNIPTNILTNAVARLGLTPGGSASAWSSSPATQPPNMGANLITNTVGLEIKAGAARAETLTTDGTDLKWGTALLYSDDNMPSSFLTVSAGNASYWRIVTPPATPDSPGEAGMIAHDDVYFFWYNATLSKWMRVTGSATW